MKWILLILSCVVSFIVGMYIASIIKNHQSDGFSFEHAQRGDYVWVQK